MATVVTPNPSISGWRMSSWTFSVVGLTFTTFDVCEGAAPPWPAARRVPSGAPSEIVEMKTNRNTVPLDRRLPARQANERLAAPSANVQPLTVFGDLQTVRPGCFATWHFLPSGARVPFPDLTVDLARHHSFARSRICAPRQKVCGDKPALGQTNDRIKADWIWRNRTSNPGQRRRLGPGVQFVNLDRFPAAMMNDVERMDRVLSRAQI